MKLTMGVKNCTLFLRNRDLTFLKDRFRKFLMKINSQNLAKKEEDNVNTSDINGL